MRRDIIITGEKRAVIVVLAQSSLPLFVKVNFWIVISQHDQIANKINSNKQH